MTATAVKVPLHGRNGAVRAYTIVDERDAELVAGTRWSLHSRGYAVGWRDGRLVLMHRLILGLDRGDRRQADHLNRDRLDNRRANLRVVTGAENAQNVFRRHGMSRFRGVFWHKRDRIWFVQCRLNGVVYYLGRFADEEEAGRAAAAWRAEHMPFSEEAVA